MRGRQRVRLSMIENETYRQVMFSKRCTGLFKIASKMSELYGTEILLVFFPTSDKALTFSNPSISAILNKYLAENPLAQANLAKETFHARHEANMRSMNSQISELEALIEDEMKVNQALCEAEKGKRSICDLSLSELQLKKHHLEMLQTHVFQTLNQPTIAVQPQVMNTHIDSSHFGANHNIGQSGASHI